MEFICTGCRWMKLTSRLQASFQILHLTLSFPYHQNRNSLIPHCRVRKKFKSDEPRKAFSTGPKQHVLNIFALILAVVLSEV